MTQSRSELLKSLQIDRETDDAEEASRRRPWGVMAAVLLALLLAMLGWFVLRPSAEPATSVDERPIVLAQNDATGRASDAPSTPARAPTDAAPRPTPSAQRSGGLVASGYVVARRRATVSAEITGRLLEILVEEGDRVEAGQVLALMDDTLAVTDLELAEARAASAVAGADALEAELVEAERALSRARQLASNSFASESNVDIEQARVAALQARIRAARADANGAELAARRQAELVDRHRVIAPFGGVIIDKNAQPGEIVSPTSAGGGFTRTGVYTLVDMESLEIEVDVNEGQIGRVKAGQQAEAVLDSYPDWRVPASVAAIIPTANRDRATIQVRVAFNEIDPRILPDMAARVTFLDE